MSQVMQATQQPTQRSTQRYFSCPACQAHVVVPAQYAGKHGKCPACRAWIQVPSELKYRAAAREPWEMYKLYVRMPHSFSETQLQPNMRFQFMFATEAEADRILASLPQKYVAALRAGECWSRGFNRHQKFQVAWKQVRLTVPDGKDLLNRVVSAGGEISEALLD